jgi:hypothetical protein
MRCFTVAFWQRKVSGTLRLWCINANNQNEDDYCLVHLSKIR